MKCVWKPAKGSLPGPLGRGFIAFIYSALHIQFFMKFSILGHCYSGLSAVTLQSSSQQSVPALPWRRQGLNLGPSVWEAGITIMEPLSLSK